MIRCCHCQKTCTHCHLSCHSLSALSTLSHLSPSEMYLVVSSDLCQTRYISLIWLSHPYHVSLTCSPFSYLSPNPRCISVLSLSSTVSSFSPLSYAISWSVSLLVAFLFSLSLSHQPSAPSHLAIEKCVSLSALRSLRCPSLNFRSPTSPSSLAHL